MYQKFNYLYCTMLYQRTKARRLALRSVVISQQIVTTKGCKAVAAVTDALPLRGHASKNSPLVGYAL